MSSVAIPEKVTLRKPVESFLKQTHKLFINGEWVEAKSGKTFEVINPATEERLTMVAEADKHDIDRAVKAAREAFETGPWRTMPLTKRAKLIWRLAELIEEHQDELAELESLDNGKPFTIARAADIPMSAEMFRYMAGWVTKIEGNTMGLSVPYAPGVDFHSYTMEEPVGVVAQIIPWNFPLLMAAWKVAPALAAGCTIVLKPAEETPLTAIRLGQLIEEAGFPPGVVNIVTGFGEGAGAPLAAHPDVDKVAFTGSTEVGRLIVKAAGETNLKKVTLELGGKSPNIILPDANMKQAIAGASNAIFFNHGQCCSAGSRLYIHEKIYDEVIEGVTKYAKKIKLGHGMDPDTQMGPLVSKNQLDRVTHYLSIGEKEGARPTAGGQRAGKKGFFVEPTVLVDTQETMKVVQEEIFGPVVAAMPFKDEQQLIDRANHSMYGLAAAIWTENLSKAHTMAKQLRAGSVWVNCYNIFDPALPFGGYKQSGWGREMGFHAIRNYLETKAVTVQL